MILKSEDSLIYWKFIMISSVISFLKKQVKQKKKLLLKSLFILLLWFSFMPQQTYFSVNEVYAADETNAELQTQKDKLASAGAFMQAISDIAFALLWPLVALAWLAMDNSLIYGSFMGLDVSLWKIWQIVRTFANYTLWFLLLIWVLWYNLSWQDSIKGLKLPDLLKRVLVASVLIQASWFLMMVLVDLSTIMTYGVWGIPSSVLWEQTLWASSDSKMLKMNVDFDLWDSNANDDLDAIKYYWQVTGDKYVAPCETVTVWFSDKDNQSFIVGREFIEVPARKEWAGSYKMLPWYCMYYWALVSYNDFYWPKAWTWNESYAVTLKSYKAAIQKKWNEGKVGELVKGWIIFPLTNWKIPYLIDWKASGSSTVEMEIAWWDKRTFGSQVNTNCEEGRIGVVSSKSDGKGNWKCLYNESTSNLTIAKVLDKAWSMTWPFSALYSSMSVYSHLKVKDKWIWQKFIITLVNTCFAVLLILPLISLVVVLFARIWLLWMAIALSPFLVLANVFDGIIKIPDSLSKYLSLSELIKLLLAPVLISFAVWLSLVFMTVLKGSVWIWTVEDSAYLWDGEAQKFYTNLNNISGIQMSSSDMDLYWFIKIKLDSTLLNISWILTMFFWLWITWFLLFWAIKQTKIWEYVWWNLQNLWETFLKTTPIIPVWKHWLSINWLMDAPEDIYKWVSKDLLSNDRAKLESLLDWWKTDNEKRWSSFVRQKSLSFNDAFSIQDTDYWNTDAMLSRMNYVYKANGRETRSNDMAQVYWEMIGKAGDRASLEKIVDQINKKWNSKINIAEGPHKIWDKEYNIKKSEDWTKYVLEWGTEEDGK